MDIITGRFKNPGVTVVVCGQYGSTGKGKVVVQLAKEHGCALALRSGGPNAGHTVWFGDKKHVTRQLPSAIAVPGVQVGIAAGGMVDPALLEEEFKTLEGLGVSDIRQRVWIDPMASVVDADAGEKETGENLRARVGSTLTGTGWTQSQRVMRKARVAREVPTLRQYLNDVSFIANRLVDEGRHVIVEGTQGFGLSLYHGGFYPQCTSRDTTAAGFVSECGLSPRLVNSIWMVLRTFPIRVAGNSGPIWQEVTWDFVRQYSGRSVEQPLVEMTSVTKKVRRVGMFDWTLLGRACMVNRPTHLAVHGLDYLRVSDTGKRSWDSLSERSRGFIQELQVRSGVMVGMAFTGPHQDDIITNGFPVMGQEFQDGRNYRKLGEKETVQWGKPLEVQG